MNKKNHIKNLIHKINRIIKEPIMGWIKGKSKSDKIRSIKMKIKSLSKINS
jgi:hypothetical protein